MGVSTVKLKWHSNSFIQTVINTLKLIIMNSLLYLVAVILIIGWAIGVFAYSATGLIHVLLVIAVVAILLRLISGRKPL
jgi:hypothetical protein